MLPPASVRASALAVRLARTPPRRLLVIQTAYLGDTVFTSALTASLRARFPSAEVDLCVSPRGRDVALAMPGVAQVHVFDKRGADGGPGGLLRTARRLRARGFDLAVLPHRSLRSALLAWLASVPERIGFARGPGSAFSTATVRDPGGTFLAREGALGLALGAAAQPMRLVPLPAWGAAVRGLLPAGPFAAVCLGSEWETKIWPARHVATLASGLYESGLVPVLLGGPRERVLAAEVMRLAPQAGCIDTTGNPVGEALAILASAALCVGGDTGLVHAARALDVPTVAIFGPTRPEAHVFARRERAVSLRLVCAPCSEHGTRRCPLGHHDCLEKLGAGPVLSACADAMSPE